MRLNETNRRRALKRRRKLMPDPRRISMNPEKSDEPEVVREMPSIRTPHPDRLDLDRVENPPEEPVTAQP
jgi:hypothetical protein